MSVKTIHVEDDAGNNYSLQVVDGITFPSYFVDDPAKQLQEVKQMDGQDADVIIAAYPKAGTHWIWEIINMLQRGTANYHPSMKEAQMLELMDMRKEIEFITPPRVFNTHLRFRHLPADMISRKCKIVYIERNPKDMAVSRFCHVSKDAVSYKGTFSKYLPLYMDGKVAFGSWFEYTMDWAKAMEDNREYPIHRICYEELKRDPVNQVQQLAEFLGVKCDLDLVQDICDRCSFSKLKDNYFNQKQTFIDKKTNPLAFAFRKGEIADWKNWFTVAESEMFDCALEERLKGYKRTFIYE